MHLRFAVCLFTRQMDLKNAFWGIFNTIRRFLELYIITTLHLLLVLLFFPVV